MHAYCFVLMDSSNAKGELIAFISDLSHVLGTAGIAEQIGCSRCYQIADRNVLGGYVLSSMCSVATHLAASTERAKACNDNMLPV